jgi:hypothetical protein
MVPSMSNSSFAQVTSESRVLQAILGLTEVVKGQTEDLLDTTENIEDDLLFKKKFYEIVVPTSPEPGAVGIIGSCSEIPEEACAYNVEGIQVRAPGTITVIVVDGTITTIDSVTTPENLLVATGIGKIGVGRFIFIGNNEHEGSVVFTGEKPQGMRLDRFELIGENGEGYIECYDSEGEEIDCPDEFVNSDAYTKLIELYSELYG